MQNNSQNSQVFGKFCAPDMSHLLQNKINILDFTSIQSLFDKLNKQLEKAQKVTESPEPPRLYIKLLLHLTVSFESLLPRGPILCLGMSISGSFRLSQMCLTSHVLSWSR